MENFLPRDRSDRIALSPDGHVKQIIAVCNGEEIIFSVKDGRFRRCQPVPNLPFFEIPKEKIPPLYRQVAAVISDYETSAKLAREVKRPEWTESLKKCGINILPDGRITIPRWITDKNGARKRILQTVKDINAAIRMQDHIMAGYVQKADMENGSEIPAEILDVLKKFSLIRPQIELRRQALVYAQNQMAATMKEALARLNKILAAAESGGNHQALADKISRLSFFLRNNWTRPYLAEIEQIMPTLNKAKRAIGKLQMQTARLLLLRARHFISLLVANDNQCHNGLTKLLEIDPITTLAKIHQLGKTDEVMAMAKKLLPGRIFYLADLLTISRLIIAGKRIDDGPAEQTLLNFDG